MEKKTPPATKTPRHGDPYNWAAPDGGASAVILLQCDKSGGKTLFGNAILSVMDQRLVEGRPTINPTIQEVEVQARLAPMFPQFDSGFDLAPVVGESPAGPYPSLQHQLLKGIPLVIEGGSNTGRGVDAAIKEAAAEGWNQGGLIRVYVIRCSLDAVQYAIGAHDWLDAGHGRRTVIVQNGADAAFSQLPPEFARPWNELCERVLKEGGTVIKLPWCSDIPFEGIHKPLKDFRPATIFSTLGLPATMAGRAGAGSMSPEEYQASQPSRKRARRIGEFVDVLWRLAEAVVDLAEAVHREGGGTLRSSDDVVGRGKAA